MTDLLQENLLYLYKHKKNIFEKIDEYLKKNLSEKKFKLVWEGELPNLTYSTENEINLVYNNEGHDLLEWVDDYKVLQQGQFDIVMYGLGLTHHLVKLLEVNKDLNFYIIEPEIDLFVEVLKVININQLLEHPQIKLFFIGNEMTDIDSFIYLKNLYSSNNRINICLPFYSAIDQSSVISFYESEYRALAIDAVEAGLEHNFGTLPYKNSIRNIEYLYRSNSLELLKGKFLNCTALVVGGGPSLERDIDTIIRNKDKMLIIAAGSSIQALIRNGVEPHIVVSIDPSEGNGRVFENVDTTNVPLVFVNQLYTGILDNRPQRNFHAFFVSDNILNYVFKDKQLEPKFISNTSVSGTAAQIAAYLGASTIVFTGQDLSFPNKQYYASGAAHVSNEKIEQYMSTNTLKVENVHGKFNDTNYSLKVTIEDIEELIKFLDNITFINSSSLGAKIKGANFKPLESVIKNLSDNKYDFASTQQMSEHIQSQNSFTLEDLISRGSNIKTVCDFLTKKCKSSIQLIKNIDEASRTRPQKAMSILAKLENEFSQVTEHDLFKMIITQWNRGLTRQYDQQVVRIEKEPTMIGKAKLLNEIVLPYIENILISFQEIKAEFQQLEDKLKILEENNTSI